MKTKIVDIQYTHLTTLTATEIVFSLPRVLREIMQNILFEFWSKFFFNKSAGMTNKEETENQKGAEKADVIKIELFHIFVT